MELDFGKSVQGGVNMIDKDYGKYYAICDECGATYGPYSSWDDAKDFMDDTDWSTTYDRSLSEYVNKCEECR